MKSLEIAVERILSGRWLLVVFYLGLLAALVLSGICFLFKFPKFAGMVFVYDDADMILAMLGLIDAALVGSLIIILMISGYENFVSRFDEGGARSCSPASSMPAASRSRSPPPSSPSLRSISCRSS